MEERSSINYLQCTYGGALNNVINYEVSLSYWSIPPLIQDIKSLLVDHVSWKFFHSCRSTNMLAHNLAKWAARILLGTFPLCIPLEIAVTIPLPGHGS